MRKLAAILATSTLLAAPAGCSPQDGMRIECSPGRGSTIASIDPDTGGVTWQATLTQASELPLRSDSPGVLVGREHEVSRHLVLGRGGGEDRAWDRGDLHAVRRGWRRRNGAPYQDGVTALDPDTGVVRWSRPMDLAQQQIVVTRHDQLLLLDSDFVPRFGD